MGITCEVDSQLTWPTSTGHPEASCRSGQGAMLPGTVMSTAGGATLCKGEKVAEVTLSKSTAMGQNAISAAVNGGMESVVLKLSVDPSDETHKEVVSSGQDKVVAEFRESGGRDSMQGGLHCNCGVSPSFQSEGLHTTGTDIVEARS